MRDVPDDILQAIQSHFHEVISGRTSLLIDVQPLELPDLRDCPRTEEACAWFPVPGMYGGFKYWLSGSGADAMLVTESWCRVVHGSGQRHEIRASGATLVEEGFV